MKNKEITQKSLNVVEETLERVKSMTNDEFMKIVEGMANFHEYSYNNQFILALSGASQVAGFRKWLELGRKVKKGSKAIWILAPVVVKKKKEDKKTGKEKDQKIIVGFRSVPVFDISQTEGEEIKKNMTTKSDIKIDDLKKVAEILGYTINSEALEIATGGYISGKTIVLNSNLNEIENTGTLIHELAHGELGHTQSNDISSRSLKEQQAETTTAVLCQILGVERKSEFYLKSWGMDEDIKKSFSRIDGAVKRIMNEF